MIPCKPFGPRLTAILLFIFIFSSFNGSAQNANAQAGLTVFQNRCASCHSMEKNLTGPALKGVLDRWGGNKDQLKVWVNYYQDAVDAGYPRAKEVLGFSPTDMQKFKGVITPKELDDVVEYITTYTTPVETELSPGQKQSNNNAVIFGVISLILAIIALILMQVNSNLKKLSDDTEGIVRPEPVPFYKNKVYIACIALLLFVVGGYYVTKGAIGLGRQKNYQPEQPIYYSHKVHAGVNQINCLFCHGNAWESKTAAIPSVNVCMNCHKAITDYSPKSMKLYRENGEEVNGTAEIAKLHEYAGFDPKNPGAWNPSMAKPIEWIKIHNLPDHVYFNHSQHIRAGKVQCQTCHGEITAMDEVKQVSELSMGWCVNCHRESKVNFNYTDSTGNKFYSIYEKFHNDFKSGKMDSITVKDIGGLECQKCHY